MDIFCVIVYLYLQNEATWNIAPFNYKLPAIHSTIMLNGSRIGLGIHEIKPKITQRNVQ